MGRSRPPAPYPMDWITMGGGGPKSSASSTNKAAPVGVTSSASISLPYIGTPLSKLTVAGAGSGIWP